MIDNRTSTAGIVHVRTTSGWKILSLEVVPLESPEETEAATQAYARVRNEIKKLPI